MRTYSAIALMLLAAVWVTACGDDDTPVPSDKPGAPFRLESTIPVDGSVGAALETRVVFHFNRVIDTAALSTADVEYFLDDEGERIPTPFVIGASGGNVVVTPTVALRPNSRYVVRVTDRVRDAHGNAPTMTGDYQEISFLTRYDRQMAGEVARVTGLIPAPEDVVYDWSTFHLYFSEPMDSTAHYGVDIALRRRGGENPVPAEMFVSGGLVVIDPVSDLEPGETYDLIVDGTLRDAGGENFGSSQTWSYTVQPTSPRATFMVEQCPTLSEGSSCEPKTDRSQLSASEFSGEVVNSMVIDSTLLGRTEAYLAGQLRVEMGDAARVTTKIPVVIRKGQQLRASSLEALFGGRIPSGLATGPITLTIVTDAFGFMESADQAFGVEGGKVGLNFILDAAVNTENSTSNAQMGQNLLGVQLTGSAEVLSGGRLVMEVAGYDAVDIFGERMNVTVSLALEPPDVEAEATADREAPLIVSSSPRPYEEDVRLESDVRLYFNEPVVAEALDSLVTVTNLETEESVIGRVAVNGPRVVFRPSWPLDPLSEYQVRVSADATDISRNRIGRALTFRFSTGAEQATAVPPRVGAADPGVNTLAAHPSHLPVQIFFTQLMDPASLALGQSVFITDETAGEDVPGTLSVDWTSVTFTPNEPFTEGRLYRWLVDDTVASIAGIELDTDEDGTPGGIGGGAVVSSYFQVEDDPDVVKLVFSLLPAADSDTSGYVDGAEEGTDSNFFRVNLFGLFKDASYATGVMVGHIRPLDPEADDPLLPITLTDGLRIFSTNTGIELGGKSEFGPLDTGPIVIDASSPGSADVTEGATGTPTMNVDMGLLFDVANPLMAGLIVPDVQLKTKGEIAFRPDGRIVADIQGTTMIGLSIPLTSIEIPLPTTIKLRAVSPAP